MGNIIWSQKSSQSREGLVLILSLLAIRFTSTNYSVAMCKHFYAGSSRQGASNMLSKIADVWRDNERLSAIKLWKILIYAIRNVRKWKLVRTIFVYNNAAHFRKKTIFVRKPVIKHCLVESTNVSTYVMRGNVNLVCTRWIWRLYVSVEKKCRNLLCPAEQFNKNVENSARKSLNVVTNVSLCAIQDNAKIA